MAVSSYAAWSYAVDSIRKIQQWGNFVFHILEKKVVLFHKLGLVEKRRKLKQESPCKPRVGPLWFHLCFNASLSPSVSLSHPPPLPTPQFCAKRTSQRQNSAVLLNLFPWLSPLINVLTSRRGEDTMEKQTLYLWVCAHVRVLSWCAAPPLSRRWLPALNHS